MAWLFGWCLSRRRWQRKVREKSSPSGQAFLFSRKISWKDTSLYMYLFIAGTYRLVLKTSPAIDIFHVLHVCSTVFLQNVSLLSDGDDDSQSRSPMHHNGADFSLPSHHSDKGKHSPRPQKFHFADGEYRLLHPGDACLQIIWHSDLFNLTPLQSKIIKVLL